MVTLSDVITALSATSSIAIIAGALFVVYQMRQNTELIEAALREERSIRHGSRWRLSSSRSTAFSTRSLCSSL